MPDVSTDGDTRPVSRVAGLRNDARAPAPERIRIEDGGRGRGRSAASERRGRALRRTVGGGADGNQILERTDPLSGKADDVVMAVIPLVVPPLSLRSHAPLP